MKKKILLLLLLTLILPVQGQVLYKTIKSVRLDGERELKIQLPRNYETNSKKKYPLILVLDGDYLFEPMAGHVDLLSYWHEIPEAIVVGVNQKESRRADVLYDDLNYLPTKSGTDFFEFLGMELLPYIDENFRTSKFVAIAGHDATANFLNYYLLKNSPIFDAFINISPELAPKMDLRLLNAFHGTKDNRWFYLATSAGDDQSLRENALALNAQMKTINNPNFHYSFNEFGDVSHFGLVGQALPLALQSIFKDFRPITFHEYETVILVQETSPYDYLLEKYERLEEYYGLRIPIRVSDFLAIGKALEARESWDELEELGKLANKFYPDTMLGTYYHARTYEANGRPEKAMKAYQSAYGQKEVSFITADFMFDRAELIKKDFSL